MVEQPPEIDEPLRWSNIGRLLLLAFEAFEDRLVAAIRAEGFEDFTTTHGKALRNIDLEGTRLVDVARRAQMSKQGMGQLLDDLERRGYVEREADPDDGRAKRVLLTARGKEFIAVGQGHYRALEADWAEQLRDPDLGQLRERLRTLLQYETNRSDSD